MRSRTTAFAAFTLFLVASVSLAADRGPQPVDLTPQFRAAGVTIPGFQALEVGGIVLLRGSAFDHMSAEDAGRIALSLGYTRVANLVRVTTPVDDDSIKRLAERELSIHRSLDGCKFSVGSENGVVNIAGEVRNPVQKDVAIALVRTIDGVKDVRAANLVAQR